MEILNSNNREKEIIKACNDGDTKALNNLNINKQEANLRVGDISLLEIACMEGYYHLINMLIYKGAIWDDTIVKILINKRYYLSLKILLDETIKRLQEKKEPIQRFCSYYLAIACRYEVPEMIYHLIYKGANPNFIMQEDEFTNNGFLFIRKYTPLSIACKNGNMDIIKALVKNGADINNRTNTENQSPLEIACLYHKLNVVCYLIEHGADINSHYEENETAMQIACKNGDLLIVKSLKECGAEVDSGCFMLAVSYKHYDVLEYLGFNNELLEEVRNNNEEIIE